jgi:hypothetical protein
MSGSLAVLELNPNPVDTVMVCYDCWLKVTAIQTLHPATLAVAKLLLF